MYRFSFVETVGGRAVEVTREMFLEVIRREKIKSICRQIADEMASSSSEESAKTIGRLKRQLPAFCWHAWFEGGKRKNYAAHPSGLLMIDLDHVDNPLQLWSQLKDESIKSGLLVAHITPSTKGLRLVFPVPQGMDIVKAQSYYSKKLKLKNVDACTKDLARLSFCVPEDYFLHISDMLFEETASPPCPSPCKRGVMPSADSSFVFSPSLPPSLPRGGVGGEAEGEQKEDRLFYDGVPYSDIVKALEELHGGVPAHGSRNNFIFSMAAYLRYICDDDPEWIATILPTYGEARDKWRRTIESACQRSQYKSMPEIVRRAIANAKVRSTIDADSETALPPAMPEKLPKLIEHLVKNVPEVCRPAVANAVFPSLAAHLKGVKFWLIDGTEKEATFMCVTMARQSSGKSSINKPIEYIIADIVERDEVNRKREQEWKDASANKGANAEKPKRPDDLCVQVLVSDMTNAAFVQRMQDAGGRYLYTNLEELDLLKQLQTNGTKDVGKIICLCFDNGKYGQERVGTQSVTARVDIRWNWNAASTVQKGIDFFKGRLVDGTLSRINFCTIIPDNSKPFVYGRYDEQYANELKPFITNLNLANGHIECPQALALARQMSEKCAEEAALTNDEVYEDMAYRAVTIAYLKAMVLFIAHDMTWSDEIAEFAQWSLEYDLWCKNRFFGEKVSEAKIKENVKPRPGRKNLLDLLPESFSRQDAANIRRQQGLQENARQMINLWVYRGYITLDQTGRYVKTEEYMKRSTANK